MNRSTPDTTICAISTPAGVGGIAVIRISGPQAIDITSRIWSGTSPEQWQSHTAHLGNIIDPADNSTIDQAVATLFRGPRSYTGQDTIELAVHGSTFIQSETLRLLIDAGATLAQPGEFTRRSFSSGRMDLVEAEAVADLIASTTKAAHRVAMHQMKGNFSKKIAELRDKLIDLTSLLELELDFSEEEVEFASRQRLTALADDIKHHITRLTDSFATAQAIKQGIPVAIIGQTNAGKSTLLNNLLGDDRAIVSDIHGTTRDTIEDTLTINGTLFRLIDTAGLRDTSDPIEKIGIERAIAKAAQAHIVLWVIDATDTASLTSTASQIRQLTDTTPDTAIIAVINKTDIVDPQHIVDLLNTLDLRCHETIPISARNSRGIDTLTRAITAHSHIDLASADQAIVTNARHYEALRAANESIARVRQGLDDNLSGDFIAQDLRETIHHLGTITGQITTTDILQTIFSRFCIGK